jgi:hypothetical protein
VPPQPTVLYDLAQELITCVTSAMTEAGLTPPGVTYVSASEPAMDDCCDGWLTARVSRLYVTEEFPLDAVNATFTGNGCDAGAWVAELSIQFAVCIPNLTPHGHAPIEALDTAGLRAAVYLFAFGRGLGCCVAGWNDADRDALLGQIIEDQSPTGNCASWTGTVTVALWECPCPEVVIPLVDPPSGVLL